VALGWGIIGRAVPALGGMSVGAPLRAGVGLLALSWALPTVADLIAEAVPGNVGRIVEEVTHDHSAAGAGGETHSR
jgi:flagellar biosynthesis protein FliR